MKIGSIKLDNNVFLAPMAGVTDMAFRIICKEMGAGLVVTEMVSAKGMYYKDEKTKELTSVTEIERPVAIQIFGSDPDIMAYIVQNYINKREDIDIVDINMGCPAPKIVKNGDGSALMKNPPLVRAILKSVVQVSNKPVTLKIRMGYDKNCINGLDIAKVAEEEGVNALTVHARTRDMFYSGEADWDFIKRIKESINIPVIGNGDIIEPEDGLKMLRYTGCDGIAIGRGSLGNPWIFKRILNLINEKEDFVPNSKEIINKALYHLNLACKFKGERVGVKEMRKQLSWYLKGLQDSNEIKNKINVVNEKKEVERILLTYLDKLIG